MNGAASTRRLLTRIAASSPAYACSVGCGRVAGASAGASPARIAPSAVSSRRARPSTRRDRPQADAATGNGGVELPGAGRSRRWLQFCGSHCEIA